MICFLQIGINEHDTTLGRILEKATFVGADFMSSIMLRFTCKCLKRDYEEFAERIVFPIFYGTKLRYPFFQATIIHALLMKELSMI